MRLITVPHDCAREGFDAPANADPGELNRQNLPDNLFLLAAMVAKPPGCAADSAVLQDSGCRDIVAILRRLEKELNLLYQAATARGTLPDKGFCLNPQSWRRPNAGSIRAGGWFNIVDPKQIRLIMSP